MKDTNTTELSQTLGNYVVSKALYLSMLKNILKINSLKLNYITLEFLR